MSESTEDLTADLVTLKRSNFHFIQKAEQDVAKATLEDVALEKAKLERVQAICAAMEHQLCEKIDAARATRYIVVSPEALLVSKLLSSRKRKSA